MKTIAVCIVNYNARDLLGDCLQSVIMENPDEIVVVDNASTDGSAEMVIADYPSVPLIRLKKNLGYGAAANRAVAHCRSDTIILLNSDALLRPGSLKNLRGYLEANEFVSIAGPRIVNPDGKLQTSSFYFPTPAHIFLYLSKLYRLIRYLPILRRRSLQLLSGDSAIVVPWVLGAALAIRRQAFEEVGGFDEAFFMYFEEVDLCYRLVQKNWQIHFAPVTEIVHVGGASTGQQPIEMNVQFFASLAQFYRKHYPWIFLVELVLMVEFFALFQLVRDTILLQFTRDKTKRASLSLNASICQRLLLGQWSRQAEISRVVPV